MTAEEYRDAYLDGLIDGAATAGNPLNKGMVKQHMAGVHVVKAHERNYKTKKFHITAKLDDGQEVGHGYVGPATVEARSAKHAAKYVHENHYDSGDTPDVTHIIARAHDNSGENYHYPVK